MRLLSLGRIVLPSVKKTDLLQTFFQKNLAASCSSHPLQRQFTVSSNQSFSTHLPSSTSLLSPDTGSRTLGYHLPSHQLSLLQNVDVASLARSIPPTEITPGSLSRTLNAAPIHTSACHQQVVNEEDNESSSRVGQWWRRHREQIKSAPTPALVLGFSGLIPFMAPAVYSLVTMSCGPNVAFAQVAYGACILSFLGGVRWGYAIAPDGSPNWPSLGFSVLPSLVAWLGLAMPIPPGLFCIITGLALAGIVDSRFKSYPPWFRSLRFMLTTFAIISISVTFVFSILYPPPAPEHGYNFKKLIKIAQIIVQE